MLRSIGAAGAAAGAATQLPSYAGVQVFGSASAAGGADRRTVVIEAGDQASYEFSVTGLLSPEGAPAAAVDGGTAAATVSGGRHEYTVTGEFTAFSVDGDAAVTVDGDAFDAEAFPHNTLEIEARGTIEYDVAASGAVEVTEGAGTAETPQRVSGSLAEGETTVVSYAGELTALDLDGTATVRNNGRRVDPTAPLPFEKLGNATVSARGGTTEFAAEFGHAAATTDSGGGRRRRGRGRRRATAAANDTPQGVVQGRAGGSGTEVVFVGPLVSLSVPGLGTVTSPPQGNAIRCRAADGGATVTVTVSGRFRNGEDVARLDLSGGEITTLAYEGRITDVTLESPDGEQGVDFALDHGADEAALNRSIRLQVAEELSRTDTYDRLAAAASANGRVRRDAEGIVAITSASTLESADLRDAVSFQLTDLDGPDRGELSVGSGDGGTDGLTKYEWQSSDGYTDRIEVESTGDLGGGLGAQSAGDSDGESDGAIESYQVDGPVQAAGAGGSSLSTASVSFDVAVFREANANAPREPGQLQSQGWFDDAADAVGDAADAAGDTLSDFTGGARDAAEGAADALSSVDVKDLEQVGTDVAITSHTVKFSAAAELAEESFGTAIKRANILWSSAITFARSDAAQQLADDGHVTGCASCAVAARVVWDAGVCGVGGGALCASASFITAGVATIGCVAFVSLACNYPNTEENARTICEHAGAC